MPSDVSHELLHIKEVLPDLGIETPFVEKAVDYIAAAPHDPKRWGGVAVDYRDAGKFCAADAVFAAATRCFPEAPTVWQARGDLFRRWNKVEGARELYGRGLSVDANHQGLLFGMAILHEQVAEYERALEWYGRCAGQRPDDARLHTNQANCLHHLGRASEARRHHATALSLDPNNLNALFSYSAFLYQQRSFDEALRLIDRYLSLDPSDAGAIELRDRIARRPARPERPHPTRFSKTALVVRGSPNYGWEGPANDAKMTMASAGRGETRVLTESEMTGMDRPQLLAQAGYKSCDLVELNKLVRAALSAPRSGDAVSVFLSYRWGLPSHQMWVRELAEELISRGYEVVLDQFLSRDAPTLDVPQLVSHMASCDVVVAVLTNEYGASAEPDGLYTSRYLAIPLGEDSWVFDEWRLARTLANSGILRLCALWRSGLRFPSPFFEGNVLDARTESSLAASLTERFPSLSVRS